MKFSEAWLREWVNPAITREKLADSLTMAGLEVDEITSVAGDFTGVVVGRVVECKQHPNADKLRVTKVDIGASTLLDIVCGAPNCREGLIVVCAAVGAVLPGDFKIKAAKLRGEPSEGMLCSYSELGISDDHSGIIELPQDASIGTCVRQYLNLDDAIIDISVTPNRGDCLSIRGVARDIAAVCGMPFSEPVYPTVTATIQDTFPIRVEAANACPRYLGRVIKGINVKAKTPLWMKEKLRRGGIRSIDPVVDITNLVLLELGQPMHAFDLSRIDSEIVVRMAKEGESLTLLDGNKISLQDDILVIADKTKALALGGIFGGEDSGINNQTQDILLECAFFNRMAIVNRARRFGLRTESSHRYERGVDFNLQYQAVERATALLLEICGGQASTVIDCSTQSELPSINAITLKRSKLDRLIGYHIDNKQVSNILTRLGCQVVKGDEQWSVLAPSWRFDMEIEEDLVEEVARIYGYDNIPNQPINADLVMTNHPETNLALKRVKSLLVDKGYQEAITYSFVDPKIQALLHPGKKTLILPNPISSEMSAMRLSLWTGLLTTVVYNQNRQQNRVRLFESGLRFTPDDNAEFGVSQELILAGVITGNLHEESWSQPNKTVDFYDLKGDIESILELTGCLNDIEFKSIEHSVLHPGQSAAILLNDTLIGYIGVVHPELGRKLDLNGITVVFEILWNEVSSKKLPQSIELSRFPANRRDIAVVVDENIPATDVLNECKKVGGNQLVGVKLFDVYQGKGIAEGCKSLAISLILQDNTRTLDEEDIATTVANCVTALKQRFQASLRD